MSAARILFLDQSGALGGAEYALRDVAEGYAESSLVVLFEDGPFRELLDADGIAVQVLESDLGSVRRETSLIGGLLRVPAALSLAWRVAKIARGYDLIYANSQKALLVGALARLISGTPIVMHLHDILSGEHFSKVNRRLSTLMANRFCRSVIADSEATKAAFIGAGGNRSKVSVVYYGFDPPEGIPDKAEARAELGIDSTAFVVGHFSRLSPWKGQEVLVEALDQCPEDMIGLFVGDAIFGEQDFVQSLAGLVDELGLVDRIVFAGFRSDVSRLMAACDLVVHSSTAPEPFGRVIVEAMLAGTPVVAADAGGPREIIESGRTGWLTPPGSSDALAAQLLECREQPDLMECVRQEARDAAERRFSMESMHAGIAQVIDRSLR